MWNDHNPSGINQNLWFWLLPGGFWWLLVGSLCEFLKKKLKWFDWYWLYSLRFVRRKTTRTDQLPIRTYQKSTRNLILLFVVDFRYVLVGSRRFRFWYLHLIPVNFTKFFRTVFFLEPKAAKVVIYLIKRNNF